MLFLYNIRINNREGKANINNSITVVQVLLQLIIITQTIILKLIVIQYYYNNIVKYKTFFNDFDASKNITD